MKLVYVEWQDHHSSTENWVRFSQLEEQCHPLNIISVGWILKKTKDCLILIPHRYSNKHVDLTPHGSGDMVILRKAIKKIISLKEPKP